MAKIKMKRHGFRLDMTPMVDVGFLLLTFFMLTAKFKPQSDDPLQITLPSALADTTKLPDANVAMINVGMRGPDTLITFSLTNEKDRAPVFQRLNLVDPKTGQPLTSAELALKGDVRVSKQTLEMVIEQSRLQNGALRYAINADSGVSFGVVDDVMHVLQKYNATRFNLVTVTKEKS